ncbi:thiol-disulfide isomerase/thioredoxin [Filimonas zeae]|uniref:Thioredoxin domain-containing protein n=1 Tax=Filimonas zeae TaxID=1737353 RepID=A0A917MUN0_9BACT|nr:TlpA disulfide reductase family protein [Filimonas zeae]MDR6339160.1 thiol-disulfide isomerase/thioredoxin [Filimonas zeae]GGH64840.1 hypothetical protein GCM10011379_17330 [Filimonas zeae]
MKQLLLVALVLSMALASQAQQQILRVKMDDVLKIAEESEVPVIVNFWATWCGPCIHEIPWFEKYVYASEKPVKLLLVSLDFKEDFPAKIAAFAKKNNYRSQIVWLEETNADSFCPKIDSTWEGAIPASLFINKAKGYRKFFGRQLTDPQFKIELEALLK